MSDIVTWISANWLEVIAIFSATVLVAERIAKLTPTTWDDNALAWVNKVLNLLALQKKA